jgi:hypothetical protein
VEARPHGDAAYGHMAGKREVDLYVKTYNTLLRSSGPVPVETLVPAHLNVESLLHHGAREPAPDMNAFMYSTLRLPAAIVDAERIVLGQSAATFARHGFADLERWQPVTAPGRRRRWYSDGQGTLAAYVASASDLDDVIPTIVAWQIEWNKMHALAEQDEELRQAVLQALREAPPPPEVEERVRTGLLIDEADWRRLRQAWGERLWEYLGKVVQVKKRLTIQFLAGSYVGYVRSARAWWAPVERFMSERGLLDRPLYFVSSNMHSIANILSGAARRRRDALVRYIEDTRHPELLPELRKLQAGQVRGSWENLLYYTARLYYATRPDERAARDREERERGITTIEPEGPVDVGVQVIELNRLYPEDFDPRLQSLGELDLRSTDAVILNINYPLGLGAYHLLSQIAASTYQLKGVYILGKAATLNARIGDVMLTDVVYDEHSGNTYWFRNCFSAEDLRPYLIYGSALDHQRAVSVLGTYLQNRGYLDFFYRENYTVVEMETGPYLNALYEDTFLTRYGQGEHVNLTEIPVDLGIIHYASDTPYSRAHTLGARGLSYYGMDSTYASTLVILRRIFEQAGVVLSAAAPVGQRGSQ